MIILLMGVAGAGKTTVGRALAEQLHWRFADADDYHSPSNVAKMRAGIALTDEDRAPWLQSLRSAMIGWLMAGENVILACSALKASYRDLPPLITVKHVTVKAPVFDPLRTPIAVSPV